MRKTSSSKNESKGFKKSFSKNWKSVASVIDRILPKPKQVVLADGTKVDPPRSTSIYVSIILLIIILYFANITEFDIILLFKNFTNIFEFTSRIFKPDFSYYPEVILKVIETIRMALLGTFVGAIASLPVAYFISANLHKDTKVAMFFINIIKASLSLLRTFPMLVYAQIILLLFAAGSGPLTGTIAVSIFTFSILTKMLYEYIETLDLGAFEAIESTGVTKLKAFTTAILPEIISVYYSYSLYCFDINIRHSTILGYVGAGGIGVILKRTLQSDNYEQSGMILLVVFVAILSIEAISKAIRRRLA
ncbi:phosphonate ABC transporter, permease protein PhnE [Mycoplasmatota bacterium zrk1]